LFQVVDLNNQGITDLTEADFEVYEDGLPISPSESELKIVKKEDLYYRIKTVLMLDNSTSLADSIDAIRLAAADFRSGTLFVFREADFIARLYIG